MPPSCSLCVITFPSYMHFKAHVLKKHGVEWKKEIAPCRPDLLPVKFSGRTKKQIVEEAEMSYLKDLLL